MRSIAITEHFRANDGGEVVADDGGFDRRQQTSRWRGRRREVVVAGSGERSGNGSTRTQIGSGTRERDGGDTEEDGESGPHLCRPNELGCKRRSAFWHCGSKGKK